MENMEEVKSGAESEDSGYFGVCPTCHKNDGYVNIGNGHWYICKEHKVMWYIGSNLFSSTMDETEEEQKEQFEKLGLENFEHIQPEHWSDERAEF